MEIKCSVCRKKYKESRLDYIHAKITTLGLAKPICPSCFKKLKGGKSNGI